LSIPLSCVFSVSITKGEGAFDSRLNMLATFPSSMQEAVVGGKPNPYEEQRNQNVQHLKKVFQELGA
jgi:hypothetical protein